MKHVLIQVNAIHPNPHRDFERNPIRKDQVEKIVESIDRTGFWDNIVVRPHPDREGEYQLAYGHNRIEAVKRAGISKVHLPVADLSDWDMLLSMIDENETQQTITPAILFENIETTLIELEKGFRKVGPKGTWEQFNRALGRVVQGCTTLRHKNDGGFEQARNAFFAGEGIGRRFLEEFLPAGKHHPTRVNEVIKTHYAEQREAAKKAEEKKKREEAKKAEEKAAAATTPEAKAKAEAEAKAANEAADKLAAEAKKIGGDAIKSAILMEFENANQMTDFAAAIRHAGVRKEHHQAAMEFIKENEYYGKQMAKELAVWWYEESGEASRDRIRFEQEESWKAFNRKIAGGDFGAFIRGVRADAAKLKKQVEIALTAARYFEHEATREYVCKDFQALHDALGQLIADLSGPVVRVEDGPRTGLSNGSLLALSSPEES